MLCVCMLLNRCFFNRFPSDEGHSETNFDRKKKERKEEKRAKNNGK